MYADFIILPSGRVVNRLAVEECRPPENDSKGRPEVTYWISGREHFALGPDAQYLYAALAAHSRPVSNTELACVGVEADND